MNHDTVSGSHKVGPQQVRKNKGSIQALPEGIEFFFLITWWRCRWLSTSIGIFTVVFVSLTDRSFEMKAATLKFDQNRKY